MTEVLTFSQALYAYIHLTQGTMNLMLGIAAIVAACAFFKEINGRWKH